MISLILFHIPKQIAWANQVWPHSLTADKSHFVIPMLLVQLNSETNIATFAFVTMVSKEMEMFLEMTSHAKISMNANAICTTAVLMHTVITPLALMIVFVLMDSMEMACPVRMLMSAKVICTVAVFMHSAKTPLVRMVVLVSKDFMGMACPVRMSMSAKTICIIAVLMHSAITLLAPMIVLV